VALARKVLCILRHLLVHRDEYWEEGISKPKQIKIDCGTITHETNLDKIIEVLLRAGYAVERITQEEARYRSHS